VRVLHKHLASIFFDQNGVLDYLADMPRQYALKANAHSISAANSLTDRDLVRLLIAAPAVKSDVKSARNANRTIIIPDDLMDDWKLVRQSHPRHTTYGDVLDRLTGAPPLAPEDRKTTITAYVSPENVPRFAALRDAGISGERVLRAALELPDGADELRRLRILVAHHIRGSRATASEWRERGWGGHVQAAQVAAALTALETTSEGAVPPQRTARSWSKISISRRVWDAWRALTWSMQARKEEVIAIGAAYLVPADLPSPVRGRSVQVACRWTAAQSEALDRFADVHPAAVITAAVEYLAADRALEFGRDRCWPSGE
jgi:hypothetical protein